MNTKNKYIEFLTNQNDLKINAILDEYNKNLISFDELTDMINPVSYNIESYRVFDKSIKMDMLLSDEITERFLDDEIHD
jgi:hypothetical protein